MRHSRLEVEEEKKSNAVIHPRYSYVTDNTSSRATSNDGRSNENRSVDAINKNTLTLPIKDTRIAKQSNDIISTHKLPKEQQDKVAITSQLPLNNNHSVMKQHISNDTLPSSISNSKDANVRQQQQQQQSRNTTSKIGIVDPLIREEINNTKKNNNNTHATHHPQSSIVSQKQGEKKDVPHTTSNTMNNKEHKQNDNGLIIAPKNRVVEHEKQNNIIVVTSPNIVLQTLATQLDAKEIADLKRYHDNSLAKNTRKAYNSDCSNFMEFLSNRYPYTGQMEQKEQPSSSSSTSTTSRNTTAKITPQIAYWQKYCTLEHVLAYLNQLCNDGKKIATINRRLSAIKKHILPSLFTKAQNSAPASRDQLILKEVETIIKGMRRTIGAEQRIRGKKPLLIEHIRSMCDEIDQLTDEDGNLMPNKQCRDRCLLLFLFFSAMRRTEVQNLLWRDLTFDARGVQILIRQSKTDQEAIGQTIGLPRLDGQYCPVQALEAWRERSNGKGEAPVFRWISPKDEIQWRVLTDQRIVAIN